MQLDSPKERNLFLSEQVTQDSIRRITEAIISINEHDSKMKLQAQLFDMTYNPKPIKIFIDSYGGMCYQCFGLLSVMDNSVTPIHTIVTGCAMSCGFLITINGHRRFAHDRATLLYHQVSSSVKGKIKDVEEDYLEAKRLQKEIEKLVLAKTSITRGKLKDIYEKKVDWVLSAKQSLKLKCIDEII